MVSVCLPLNALSQHVPSYLGFSYLGRGVPLHSCSSKAPSLLLTLDEVAPPDLERGVAPLGRKAFDCVDHNKLWKILKEMGIRDHMKCLLRNLYAGQEGRQEEIPLIQGKRNPSKMVGVARGHQRADTLKP